MTCREKLMQEHPGWDNKKIDDIIRSRCPWNYGYFTRPSWCTGGTS